MKCLLYQQFLLTSHRVNRIPMPLCTAALFPQDRSSNETNHLHSISQFRNKDKLSCCAGLTKQQQEPDKYTFEPHKGRSIRDLVVRAWKLQKTCRSVRDQLSHDGVRETIICVLLFICLYIISYLVIIHCNRNAEFTTDDSEDATVNKIALWLCTFTLSLCQRCSTPTSLHLLQRGPALLLTQLLHAVA